MPLYDFSCPSCGEEFEARVAVDETPPCPRCGEVEAQKRMSPFAGPFTIRPRGRAAKRSDETRRDREQQRAERREARRQARENSP